MTVLCGNACANWRPSAVGSAMAKLKLGPLGDDKPVKVTLDIPASLHRDLVAYIAILGQETGQAATDPVRLIVPMLQRFIVSDRGFAKVRRESRRETGD